MQQVHIPQAIAAIAADTTAGAVEVAERASHILRSRALTGAAPSADAFRHELLATGWALIRAQPSMAPLVNLVNGVLWKLESVDSPDAMQQAVVSATEDFSRHLRMHEVAIAEAVLPLILDGSVIVTTGRSTTVRAALRHAHRAGRRFSVLSAESRPMPEGRLLATELAESGMSATLITDAVAVSNIPNAQLVLVGADHLALDGLVNKAGTHEFALACRASGVPLYTLCGSEKFLSPGYTLPHLKTGVAAQTQDAAHAGMDIHNYEVDSTPLDLLSSVVTEKGALTREGVEAWLATIRLHPALLDPDNIQPTF